jgi:hypothetical protein
MEEGLRGAPVFARIGAVVSMRVEDYFANGKRWWVRLHEKGGKRHEMPAHHKLEAYLDEYVRAAGIAGDDKGPDAVLAARLKWPRPLPLIAGALVHPSLRSGGHRPYPGDPNWTRSCCVAYGRAAVAACDLFAELGRSSQKLIAVAPRLRARGAGAVIETLLNEDAVPAAARRGAISARGSRRLFDRLVALGGVRELTGRSTFRLYGL